MCAIFGINHIYTQPYHHQANGRAERAGQQLIEVLRKLTTQERQNWLELLPRAINIIHDAPGESGLSPYEILFGRERYMARVPYNPPRYCEDALEFFERMDSIDEEISQELNSLHRREAARIHAHRKERHALPRGRKVWYKRPEGWGNKLHSRWVGPGVVLLREGESSYKISTGPN